MPINPRVIRMQHATIQRRLGQRWGQRYPTYMHRKDHPVLLPKLFCRIVDMAYSSDVVTVTTRISNIGSGASYNTRIHFYYTVLPAQILHRPSAPPSPPRPLHEQLQLQKRETITIQPGETREISFSTAQQYLPLNEWQAVVLCYDPITDTLPMRSWHPLLQPVNNLLLSAENPPRTPPIPNWDEFDSPDSTQPRVVGRTWKGRGANPEPVARRAAGLPAPNPTYFSPEGSSTVSELRQTVAVDRFSPLIERGDLAFTMRGFVRSYSQRNPDLAQMLLECLDTNGAILSTLDLGPHAFIDAWHLLSGTIVAPVATRQVRVRLRSTRRSRQNNDGYYDSVQLIPSHRQISTALRTTFN